MIHPLPVGPVEPQAGSRESAAGSTPAGSAWAAAALYLSVHVGQLLDHPHPRPTSSDVLAVDAGDVDLVPGRDALPSSVTFCVSTCGNSGG